MIKDLIKKFALLNLLIIFPTFVWSQGIIVHQKNGTIVTFPYEIIDSIVTYKAAYSSIYVINQGSYYDGIDGSISTVDIKTGKVVKDAFKSNNGISIGGSPQPADEWGNFIYVPAFESNRVWILNAKDLKVKSYLATNYPNCVEVTKDYIFITNNDGYLSIYNTDDLTLLKKLSIGPNPCHMTISGGELFISISDGYNYPTYANGYRLARVSLTDLTLNGYISVGMNPGQLLTTTDGNLVVVCRGDYGMTPSQVLKVNPNTNTNTYICDGSYITVQGNKLYVINATTDWDTYETINTYKLYDTDTCELLRENFIDAPQPAMPIAIQCAPNGDIFITSQLSLYDYTSPGLLFHYNSEGQFVAKYSVGTSPCGILFK